jgi:tetratricopeptide (TPR) repeat protein
MRELFERRFAGLAGDAAGVLAAAAVLGRQAPIELIVEVARPGTAESGMAARNELCRRCIVREVRPGVLRFEHDKLREACYDRLDTAARGELHGAAATALEQRLDGAERSDPSASEHAGALAAHCYASGRLADGARYERGAARRALRQLALAESIERYERALRIVDRLTATADINARRVDMRLELYTPRMHLYGAADERMLALCREAEPTAIQLGDPQRLADLYAAFSGCWFGRARYDDCAASARQSIAHAARCADLTRTAAAARVLTGACLQTGRFAEAREVALPVIARIEAAGRRLDTFGTPYPPYVTLCGMLGVAEAALGRTAKGAQWNARAEETAVAAGDRYSIALAHVMWGWALELTADGEGCMRHGDAAIRVAEPAGLSGPRMMGMYAAGLGRVLTGDAEGGASMLRDALELSRSIGYVALRSEAWYGLALAALELRDATAARSALASADRHAAETGERKLAPDLLLLRARLERARGHDAEAASALERACVTAEEQGRIAACGRAHLEQGELLLAQGRRSAGMAELRRAQVRFDDCDLEGWSEVARRRWWRAALRLRSREPLVLASPSSAG